MKKNYLFQVVIFLLFVQVSFSQENDDFDGTGKLMFGSSPVSPEAANLGKYGDLPVNLATGRLNFTIPIYTIKMNDFELPIYLSYNYQGLLAEEDPGIVGLGWTLNAGGMIIRQLRGRPDDDSAGYLVGHLGRDYVIPYLRGDWNDGNHNQQIVDLLKNSRKNIWDTQPDEFVINVANLSANFSYDESGRAIFYPQKSYRINAFSRNNNFLLVDNKGIKYEFNDKSETSVEYGESAPIEYTSSWHLSRISLPNSEKYIGFSYIQDATGQEYNKTIYSETFSQLVQIDGNTDIYGFCPDIPFSILSTETTITRQRIRRITFPEGSLIFDVRLVKINDVYRHYLDSIIIKDKFGTTINTYRFVYDDIYSNFKLLREIKKTGRTGNEIPFYRMEYKGIPPKKIHYASQDTWGFYNGRNNSNLTYGDRSVVFEKGSLGALTKIFYPTGGYSKIAYESNRVKELFNDFDNTGGVCFTTAVNKTIRVDALSLSDLNSPRNHPAPPDKTLVIPFNQTVRVTLYAEVGGMSGMAESEASISNENSSTHRWMCNPFDFSCNEGCATSINAWQEQGGGVNGEGDLHGGRKTSYFRVKKGTILKLSASASSTAAFAGAGVIVNYSDDNLSSGKNYVEVGGIRIASIKDCDRSENCVSKTYKYQWADSLSSGMILQKPLYWHLFSKEGVFSGVAAVCKYMQKFSRSKVPLTSFQGSPVLYRRVEILTNNSQRKGKTVKYFSSFFNPPLFYPYAPKNPKDWKKGNLIMEENYEWKNNHLSLVDKLENQYEVKYPYQENERRSIGMVVGEDRFSPSSMGGVVLVGKKFVNRPQFYHLKSTVKTSYFDNDSIVNATNYLYDRYTGNLIRKETKDSRGKTIIDKILYPNDVDNNTSLGNLNLTSEEVNSYKFLQKPDINHQNRQNRISEPIQTEKYINNRPVFLQRTTYKDWGAVYDENDYPIANKHIVAPKDVLFSKGGNNLKTRIVYHQYDHHGNPLEVSKADGTHVYYIWGYDRTQLIAKIMNFTSSQAVGIRALIDAAVVASDADDNESSENSLRNKLQAIRDALPADAQMIYFTYDPLVGMTSISDEKGDLQYYIYDDFNRPKQVKDKNGNILKEKEYHYMPILESSIPIEGSVSITSHNISESKVNFAANIESGSGNYTYEWSVISGGMANGSTTNSDFSVGYACASNKAHIFVKCIVRDAEYPDNSLTLSKYFEWNCLSNGHLRVTLDYDTEDINGGGDKTRTIYTLTSVDFMMLDINGGSGDLTYKWYYKETGNDNYVFLGASNVPHYTMEGSTLDPNPFPCRSAVMMRCVIIDNVNGQVYTVDEHFAHEILCGPY